MPWSKEDFQSVFSTMARVNGDTSKAIEFENFWHAFPYHELSSPELDALLDTSLEELDKSRFYGLPRLHNTHQKIASETLRIIEWDTPKASLSEITDHMRVMASHRLLPPEKLLNAVKDRIAEFKTIKRSFNLAHLARVFATLNEHPDDKIIEIFSKSIIDLREKLNPKDLAMLAWSFSIFQMQSANATNLPVISLLHQDAEKAASSFSFIEATQFFDASLYNGLPLLHKREVQEEQASRTEARVQQILNSSMAFRIREAEQVQGLNHDIDLAMEWKKHRFYIEVDGPFHFVTNLNGEPLKLDGNTLLQSALLKKCMPAAKIIRMRDYDIDAICESDSSVNKFLSMAICLPAGVYLTQNRGLGNGVALNSILPSRMPHIIEKSIFQPIPA